MNWRLYGYNPRILFLVTVNIFDGFTHGGDLLSILIRDLCTELVLKGHDQFHEIERISLQVLAEAGFRRDLRLIRTEQILYYSFEFSICVSHDNLLFEFRLAYCNRYRDRVKPAYYIKLRNTAPCQKLRRSTREKQTTS